MWGNRADALVNSPSFHTDLAKQHLPDCSTKSISWKWCTKIFSATLPMPAPRSATHLWWKIRRLQVGWTWHRVGSSAQPALLPFPMNMPDAELKKLNKPHLGVKSQQKKGCKRQKSRSHGLQIQIHCWQRPASHVRAAYFTSPDARPCSAVKNWPLTTHQLPPFLLPQSSVFAHAKPIPALESPCYQRLPYADRVLHFSVTYQH